MSRAFGATGEEDVKVLFTDPNNPAWTLVDYFGCDDSKPLIFHTCADPIGEPRLVGDEVSENACGYCTQEPPPGFIAIYKLYTWDNK